jgi:hypothetical protein
MCVHVCWLRFRLQDKDGNVALDPEVDLLDTWKVMESFVKDGKVTHSLSFAEFSCTFLA